MGKTNVQLLRERFIRAGYSQNGRDAIMGSISGGNDKELQETINSMDRLSFEEFFRNVVIPASATLTRSMIEKFPKETESLSRKQTSLAKMGNEWDGDRFRSVIGRKPRKAMYNGKEVTLPARIGEINEQDILNLLNEGLSIEEIQNYANKFRGEEEAEFYKRQGELIKKTRKELEERQRKERETNAKNATDYLWEFSPDDSKVARALKIAGNTAIGTGIDVFLPEVRAEFERAISEGRDPRAVRALIKDFGFNALMGTTPIGVSKLVAKTGLKGLKNVGANVAGNLSALTLENMARQGSSDHYRFDPKNALKAAAIGATIPGILTSGLMGATRLFPSLQKYTRPALRRAKGLMEGPEASEVEVFEQYADDVHNFMSHIGNGESWSQNNAYRAASERAQLLANRMNTIYGTDEFNQGQIMNMVSTRKGLKEFKNMLQAPTPEEYGMMSDANAKRAETAFPGIVNEIKENSIHTDGISKSVDLASRLAEDYGGFIEPVREVYSGWGRMPSRRLDSLMNENPILIQGWENGVDNQDSSIMELYDEWVDKYKSKR